MKTEFPKEGEKWYVVDADGVVLGRLATQVTNILRGKHRVSYSPHMANGDHIVVINASRVRLTGNKKRDKMYYHHTGHPGGIKGISAAEQLAQFPERLIKDAVWGMLPKNALNRQNFKKLRVYGGSEHPHLAQQPEPLELKI